MPDDVTSTEATARITHPAELQSEPELPELQAHRLAQSHRLASGPGRKPALTELLDRYDSLFEKATQYFRRTSDQELALSYAAEWMLDNFYIVRQALREIKDNLPRKYYRQLPKLVAGELEGYPRVYDLARVMILLQKARLDIEQVEEFVYDYQTISPLTMGELWALPIMLRLGILQSLVLAVSRITGLFSSEESRLPLIIDHTKEISDDDVVANSILSLRELIAQDWKNFFEKLSLVDQVLSHDPVGVYPGMDFETRDRYRKTVEEIAMAAGKDELVVAGEVIRLAQIELERDSSAERVTSGNGQGSLKERLAVGSLRFALDGRRAAHAGYYLLDRGRQVLERNLGYHPNLPTRLKRWAFNHPTLVYIGSIGVVAILVIISFLNYVLSRGGSVGSAILAGILLLVPALTVSVDLLNWAFTLLLKPQLLPKMNFEAGIPEAASAIVVIPGLLSNPSDVEYLLKQLEQHYLRNLDPHLYFALLTDFSDAAQERMPEDEALLEAAKKGVQALNERYQRETEPAFTIFHRKRIWNASEGAWMGWERKRGKLHELNQLILGTTKNSFIDLGFDISFLHKIRYVITLDADTILPRDCANRLVAAHAHPLSQAEFDPRTGDVVAGYTVLQPRTEIQPVRANQSLFTRVFARDTGLDLYSHAASDVYQDLFGEGIYVGKGIYDVRSFERSLEGRVPENALLSHDLFEGIQGRVGLVSDIVLLEDFPPHYLVHARRSLRWVRGDWQLLPWLFPWAPDAERRWKPNPLSIIDRWKILDNLRRSLVAPALLFLMAASWLWLPGSPLVWTATAVLALGAPFLIGLVSGIAGLAKGAHFRQAFQPTYHNLLRWSFAMVFLPYEGLLDLDAILVTLERLFLTRRHLLQWITSAHTTALFGEEIEAGVTRRHMVLALGITLLLGFSLAFVRPVSLLVALPLILAWLLSPQIATLISRPIQAKVIPLGADQRRELRLLARRTWFFFEQYVGPEDHWLPPDHFQEQPLGIVAHRTSPTNIGLLLLSTLAAYDFGYVGLRDFAARIQSTFESMGKLERYLGHFLNWYDTRTLEPLPPRYVSTVDSGNLAACLIILKQACLANKDSLLLRWESWEGWLDTLGLAHNLMTKIDDKDARGLARQVQETISEIQGRVWQARDDPDRWIDLLAEFSGAGLQELDSKLSELIEKSAQVIKAEHLRQLRLCTIFTHSHIDNLLREVRTLLPWKIAFREAPGLFAEGGLEPDIIQAWESLQDRLLPVPRLSELGEMCAGGLEGLERLKSALASSGYPADQVRAACDWCERLERDLDAARNEAGNLIAIYDELRRQAEAFAAEMDYRFLFDAERQVFHIGYNLSLGRLDNNYYDLLASEARIASLIAIAKGDVPQSHWLHLSRPFTRIDGTQTLLSWSATLFEYLMPLMFARVYDGTLLYQSAEAAIRRQIVYGEERGVPWGISESGYYRFDENMAYQYRAFGVPGLGYKRGLVNDLVVAPYASLLALPLQPQEVMRNLDALERYGMLGAYGFYESIDFTRTRLPLGESYRVVQSFMSHHQGMILGSLANSLMGNLMVDRFHSDPYIESVELLLQEQIPENPPIEELHGADGRLVPVAQPKVAAEPWRVALHTPQPRVHFLSNGSYGVFITSSGAGYSAWKDIDLTRWRPDTTLNDWGFWVYIQDLDSGALWSASYQPAPAPSQSMDVFFNAHQVEFHQRNHEISSSMDVTVAPHDDVEIRRIRLTNHSSRTRRLSLTSYAEVILEAQTTDQRHPAFNKLFIESESIEELNALLFRRRPRSGNEEPVYLVHSLVTRPDTPVTGAFEGDRMQFLGRGGTARRPKALVDGWGLSGSVGATLDPIMALGQEVELEPHASVELAFLTCASSARQASLDMVARFREWHEIERLQDQARLQAEVELRQLGLDSEQLELNNLLLSLLTYPHLALRAAPQVLAENTRGQSGLWGYGISGDYPILLVRIRDQEQLSLVNEALKAHAYWRDRSLSIDLVLLNEQGSDYSQELNSMLHRLLVRMNADAWLNRKGGVYVLRVDQMPQADLILLQSAARVILDGGEGSLKTQLEGLDRLPSRLPPFFPTLREADILEETPELARPDDLLFDNGLGGFTRDGREYVIYLDSGQSTPVPWSNVVANPNFGFLVSESGGGFSWSMNSGENRLTPWSNDPVSDRPGEALYLRDEETAEVWSPAPLPAGDETPYKISHGAGYTVFEHNSHGLKQTMRLFSPVEDPLKIVRLRLENTWSRVRRITATYYAEWVLGPNREGMQQFVLPEFDDETQALLARNPYNSDFGERVAFLAASKRLHGLTADRTEFLGRVGSLRHPAGLGRVGLTSRVEAGIDPCAALQLHIDLQPGQAEEVYFLLGQGESREESLSLVRRYREASQVERAWAGSQEFWDRFLGTIQVQTPEPAFNILMNRWLLYQALSCRIWGRSAFYQSSGAYGFRDQLQDINSLLWAAPEVAREHILRAARHQFEEGDVLHWWHPPSGRGVRTRFSDDLLWLPYIVAHYVEASGDRGILDEKVAFRKGAPLEAQEEERYGQYALTAEAYPLLEHCLRSIDKGVTSGPHRLPLIGSGDWNDGMNRVGVEGRGESVWLAWFLIGTLNKFADLLESKGEGKRASAYRGSAEAYRQAIEASAWDGEWYLRAFYDDGTPLGSAKNGECQVDSLSQSWALLSGSGQRDRAEKAMQSVSNRLVKPDPGLILLFTPPFDKTQKDPGYIKGYLPGIRENGGQYTHAALWAIWAYTELGEGDTAESLLRMINPVYHADTREKAEQYKVEPYVIAADVYGAPPHTGRGGWTWYTGSSGWMHRLGLEAILGLRREGQVMVINPCIPKEWREYQIDFRKGPTWFTIQVENPDGVNRGVKQVILDEEDLPGIRIPILEDGKHHQVRVILG